MNDETLTAGTAPVPQSASSPAVWGLALAWDADAPERIGEVLALPGTEGELGRGAGDGAPRAQAYRIRPGRTMVCAPLATRRLSRRQLTLTATASALSVERVGRAAMRVNGAEVDAARLRAGDVVAIDRACVFVVVRRPLDLPESGESPPFAEADAAGMVGESAAAWALRHDVAFVGPRPGHVLLMGPSGSGKELAARAVHQHATARGPMLARNAVTIPEALADAELFGNLKDYPNPGMPDRKGLVGEADGGTLMLDEIGDLPEPVQARLLRLMDDGEYQRLGEARPRRASVRIVGATHRPPERLKHDLLARFRHRVKVPGLHERKEDIPLIARHLLRLARQEDPTVARIFVGDQPRLAQDLVEALLLRGWNTHARELDRLLWDALRHSRGDLLQLTPDVSAPAPPPRPTEVAVPGPDVVEAALAAAGGNVSQAWKDLGLRNRDQLRRLIKKYGLG